MSKEAIIYQTLQKTTLVAKCPRTYLMLIILVIGPIGTLSILFNISIFFSLIMIFVLYINGVYQGKKDPDFFDIWLSNIKIGQTKESKKGNVYYP